MVKFMWYATWPFRWAAMFIGTFLLIALGEPPAKIEKHNREWMKKPENFS